jgi:phage replication O-like protein O
MAKMGASAFKVVMAVARKTVGWNKTEDALSLSQLEEITGLSRKTLISAIKESVANSWLVQKPVLNTFSYRLGDEFFCSPSSVDIENCSTISEEKNSGENSIHGVKSNQKMVEQFHTQKTTKETITKDNSEEVVKSEFPDRSLRTEDGQFNKKIISQSRNSYANVERTIDRLLGENGSSLWQAVKAKYVILRWIAESKSTVDALLYALAYALEKGKNPGIVFNMIKSAPFRYLPAWSDSIDLETGKPEWKRFIWNAFGDEPDPKFVDQSPFVF